MSIKGFEMLREHMSYYDFNPDSVLLLGNVLHYLKQAEGEVAELESENKKLRKLVRDMWEYIYIGTAQDGQSLHDRTREMGIEVNG